MKLFHNQAYRPSDESTQRPLQVYRPIQTETDATTHFKPLLTLNSVDSRETPAGGSVRLQSTHAIIVTVCCCNQGRREGGQGGKLPRALRQRRGPAILQNEFLSSLVTKAKVIIQIFIFINCATTFRRRSIVAQEWLQTILYGVFTSYFLKFWMDECSMWFRSV